MERRNLLLVDFNNLLYRSTFAHQELSHEGTFTGGIYGVLDMVSAAVNRYKIDRLVVCCDSKPYFRALMYPDYKSDRKPEQDEDKLKMLSITRKQMRKFFKTFKIPVCEVAGYEADDFIGKWCLSKNSRDKFGHIFIMSNDTDFYQLLTGRVFLIKTGGLFGRNDFLKQYPEIRPYQWPRCIALKGSHNGVAGIKGVGDVTAYKVVAAGITDKEIWVKWRWRARTVKLRTQLATFPFPLAEEPPLAHSKKIKYNAAMMEEVCNEYGIRFVNSIHTAFMRLGA